MPAATSFPFSSHQSAKICLKSALNIAQSFDNLPFPIPCGRPLPTLAPAPGDQHPPPPMCYLSPTSSIIAPRTMPSFACCAMQSAYALLMVHQKTKSAYPPENGLSGPPVSLLLGRLQQGLTSVFATLENYATAFEALGGMRGVYIGLDRYGFVTCEMETRQLTLCRSDTECYRVLGSICSVNNLPVRMNGGSILRG